MPFHSSFIALWALAVAGGASSAALSARQSTGSSSCTSLHIFLIRGWNESYPGRQGALVDAICAGLDSTTGCDYEDVVYDTTLSNPDDITSCPGIQAGREAGAAQIAAYSERCADTKLVVSGFSEGANVLGEILGGSTCGDTLAGLDVTTAPGSMICAATIWGDGRHTANQTYNVLSGAPYDGEYPRSLNASSLAGLDTFSAVLRAYCQDTDQICAYSDGTPYVEEYHTNYFDLYSDDAGSWIRDMCDVSTATPTSTATSTSATASATATSSSVCTAGTAADGVSGNFLGLCSFACNFGFCPDDVCTCTATGAQITAPATTGVDGCPLDGEDSSYDELCSYACNHGYCPDTACQTC